MSERDDFSGGGPPNSLDIDASVVSNPPGEEGGSPPTLPDATADERELRRLTAFREAHNEKLRRAGKFAGMGYPRSWIAERFGVREPTVADWEKEHVFLEAYAASEGHAQRAAANGLAKIALSLDALIDRALRSALGDEKDSAQDRRYLIDKVITPMSVQHTINEHRGGERFFEPIAQALVTLANRARPAIPAVIEGSIAAEEYGAAAEMPKVPPNGSGELPQ